MSTRSHLKREEKKAKNAILFYQNDLVAKGFPVEFFNTEDVAQKEL